MDISPVVQAEAASDLKGDVSKIGASLCFFMPISLMLSSAIINVFSIMTALDGKELLLKMQSGPFYIIYTLLSATLPLIFCTWFMLKLFKGRFSVLSLRPSVSTGSLVYYIALGILAIPISAAVSNLSKNILEYFNIKTNTISVPSGKAEIVFFIIIFAVVIPILEEVLFRFAVLERLRRYGDIAAIVISAMFFSLAHCSFQSFAHAFVMGLVLGFVAVKTKSALASITIHFINNLLSMISLVISASSYAEAGVKVFSMVIAVLLITALIIVLASRNKSREIGFEFKGKEIKAARKASILFTNFWVILFIIISISYAFFTISI